MGEADNRTEPDGKGLFIIRNGKKVAKYEAGKSRRPRHIRRN